jgi:hypothetical protein
MTQNCFYPFGTRGHAPFTNHVSEERNFIPAKITLFFIDGKPGNMLNSAVLSPNVTEAVRKWGSEQQ